jgi:beta-xylosidase
VSQRHFSPILLACTLLAPVGCSDGAADTTADAAAPPSGVWNPIIWADVPDPALLRVRDTYYMSSTTMHMSPGLPIMKSTDLVNWEMASYAYDTLGHNDALTLRNGESAYGSGSWASSLRYHDGRFYVSTFSNTTDRTHIYVADDPETGPWEAISFEPSLHDHSLFFDDDGRVYMAYSVGDIALVELNADLSGIKPDGFNDVIIEEAHSVVGEPVRLRAEGSQLFKKDGVYYLVNITWPTDGVRTVIVHRAPEITGPWEGRMVLQDQGVAQGTLIDTPDGEWYAWLFKDHGSVGRIPYLVPVTWEDGWPVLGVDGRVPATLDLPARGRESWGVTGIVASDEFEREPGDATLPMAWQWNHNPDDEHWQLLEDPGRLRLTNGRVDTGLLDTRNTLTQRTFGPVSSGVTAVDVAGMRDGDYAGLALLQRRYGFVGVKMEAGQRSIVMVSNQPTGGGIVGEPAEVAAIPTTADRVYLKADADFRGLVDFQGTFDVTTDLRDTGWFYYSLDAEEWTRIGEPLRMIYSLPHFMGYRFGLFNFATRETGGYADFDFYRVSDATRTLPSG